MIIIYKKLPEIHTCTTLGLRKSEAIFVNILGKSSLQNSIFVRNRIQYNPNFLFLSADWLEIYIKKIFHEYDRYISPNIIDIEVRAGFQFPENPSRYN